MLYEVITVKTFVHTGFLEERIGLYLYGEPGRGRSGLAAAAVVRATEAGALR